MRVLNKLAYDFARSGNTFIDSFFTAENAYKAGFEKATLCTMNRVANAARLGFIHGDKSTLIMAIEDLLKEEECLK